MFTAMLVLSAALGVITSVTSGVASYFNNKRNAKLAKQVKQLAREMSADTELMNQLSDAYNRRDAQLLQNIMMSSPFGTRLMNLKNQYQVNLKDIRALNAKKVSVAEEQAKINAAINKAQTESTTTGSVIGDLIKGGGSLTSTPEIPKYEGSGYNQTNLSEVNYGQKK